VDGNAADEKLLVGTLLMETHGLLRRTLRSRILTGSYRTSEIADVYGLFVK